VAGEWSVYQPEVDGQQRAWSVRETSQSTKGINTQRSYTVTDTSYRHYHHMTVLGLEGGASSSQLQLSGTHCRFTFALRPSVAVSFKTHLFMPAFHWLFLWELLNTLNWTELNNIAIFSISKQYLLSATAVLYLPSLSPNHTYQRRELSVNKNNDVMSLAIKTQHLVW